MQDSKELLFNRVDSSEKDMKVHRGFNIPPEEEEAFLLEWKEAVAGALQEVLDLHIPLDPSEYSEELLSNRVDSSKKDVKVRRGFNIPPEEEAFLLKRKEVVASALQKILDLDIPLDPSEVPTVAVVCSGGGSRAMTGTYGSLKGLQRLGLLDVITYMTAVSGSTWTFASLFSDDFWSKKNLDKEIASKKIELSKSYFSLVSFGRLIYYYFELYKREREGYPVSNPVDLWGLVVEQLIFGKEHTKTLSDQKMAVSEGQNPLPIYTAVKMDESASADHDWCEFTPFEVGFFNDPAFVSAEDFGSKFYKGHVVKNLPETRIPFLLGIWSSFFSVNLLELLKYFLDSFKKRNARGSGENGLSWEQMISALIKFIHNRPLISRVFNFLRGLFPHNTLLETDKDTDSDKTTDLYLNLVDSAHAIDTAFPPVLRPHRRADIILSLNYSLGTDHLQDLKKTQKYCIDHKIPFPKIDFSKYSPEPKEEVYVFMDEENPYAPIVLHFPLVNLSFKEYIEPGVKRTTEEELKEGEIDVSSENSPYKSSNLTYSPEDFQRLVNLTNYNIINNKETIINKLKTFFTLKNK